MVRWAKKFIHRLRYTYVYLKNKNRNFMGESSKEDDGVSSLVGKIG